MVTGSAVLIGISLIFVILIQWTDQGSFGMGQTERGQRDDFRSPTGGGTDSNHGAVGSCIGCNPPY